MLSWRAIHKRFPWLDPAGIVLVLIIGFLSFKYEDFKNDLPRLITWQLRAYQWITGHGSRQPQVHWVTPIEIDDATFYDFLGNETRDDVTDRAFLAKLVEAATQAGAAVIALDINLDQTASDKSNGPSDTLNADDQALLDAIRKAQEAHIPVVLTFGFRQEMVPVPQIFDHQEVFDGRGISYRFPEDEVPTPRPAWVARYGFDHPADDLRKVPLVTIGVDSSGKEFDFYSFALQITDAYTQSLFGGLNLAEHAPVPETKVLADKLTKHEFVYTTFMPAEEFISPELRALGPERDGSISGMEVFCAYSRGQAWEKGNEKRPCPTDLIPERMAKILGLLRGRIVLIGGDRHGYKGEQGDQDYLDNHPSPVGLLRGMYFQANYIEGLLDNRVLFKVNRWAAALFDMVLAALMLWIVSRHNGFWKRHGFVTPADDWTRTGRWMRTGVIVVLLLVPAGVAWFAAVECHRCLDFLFPLVLLLLHPAIESYIHLVHGSHSPEVAHN